MLWTPLAPENNVRGLPRRNKLNAFVSEGARVDSLEQSLPRAKEDRRDGDVQLIDKARAKVLLDRAGTTAKFEHPFRSLRRAPGQAPRECRRSRS